MNEFWVDPALRAQSEDPEPDSDYVMAGTSQASHGYDRRNNEGANFDPHEIFSDISDNEEEENDGWDELNSESEDEFVNRDNSKKRGRGRGGYREPELSPEVTKLLAEASLAYSNQDTDTAIQLIEEAITLDPSARRAYILLAAIYEDTGDWHKVLAAKITAVHLNKKNYDEWIECAQLSEDLGNPAQAVEFYGQALRVNPQKVDVQLKRVELLRQIGNYTRALKAALNIRQNLFYLIDDVSQKSNLIMDLAISLKSLGRAREAIEIYEDILAQNIRYDDIKRKRELEGEEEPESDSDLDSDDLSDGDDETNGRRRRRRPRRDKYEPEIPFLFNELNNLAELYYYEKDFSKVLTTVRDVARFLNGRKEETWWKEVKTDAEFDERRKKLAKFKLSPYANDDSKFELPIDIRYWLVLSRLELDKDPSEALNHVKILQTFPPLHYSDLYLSIGEALYTHGHYAPALELFEALEGYDEFRDVNLEIFIAKCLFQQKHFDDAERRYIEVIQVQPDNIEALVALAELYGASNRISEARDLIAKVNTLRSTEDQQVATTDQHAQPEVVIEGGEENRYSTPDFINRDPAGLRKPSKYRRLTHIERVQRERDAENLTEDRFRQLKRYDQGRFQGNPAAISEWLRNATGLIYSFKSYRRFFYSEKSKMFSSFEKKYNTGTIEERIEHLSNRITEQELDEDEDDDVSEQAIRDPAKFRNITFEDWFDIFMETALLKARYESPAAAFEVIEIARNATVFHLDPTRVIKINLVDLTCAYITKEFGSANDSMRLFMNSHQIYNDIYRLYGAIFCSGNAATEMFRDVKNQKFFLRQVKAVDSLVQKKDIAGASKIYDKSLVLTQESPVLLLLYGHIMLLGKSYVSCLIYLLRVYALKPKDTLLLLTMGLVHVHRALQRQTTNRHLQIVQGLSYLLEYYDERGKKGIHEQQEADYNMGRIFHLLGLNSFAVEYYNRVLAAPQHQLDPDYDLRSEAAYNLHLIYMISGNPRLARAILDKYLVI
ncbi:transcription factor TFIIIC subunit TFC4 [Sugiyamaella lignohabitans]|uniref:Transcription factor TFIIIC subunit TFC4 n=1 Tax=Sugiyamaella lignohabitans TaxID=796027 RepID=A0A167F5N8_9ASCO|nr:transcription factor TFIIIC subunit TFC4 [Sugiyamaella lignohabitans]ANB14861.1 transcription factor TFIIIC subunit TFC4 [Sugiyamaella lignohabitans]